MMALEPDLATPYQSIDSLPGSQQSARLLSHHKPSNIEVKGARSPVCHSAQLAPSSSSRPLFLPHYRVYSFCSNLAIVCS